MNSVRNPYVESQKILSLHCLPPRATMIPAQKPGVFYRNKEESDRIFSLNGDWDFLWKPDDLPVCPEDEWHTIDVPSVWQYRGYGFCTYPNVEYPIPFAPPYVLAENPVGYYRRTFVLNELPAYAVLHFAGVDNAYFVRINGTEAGFAKGSRCAHEFDVTGLLHPGENTIEVKVYTYSDATYVENQDMLLANGIFRDVFLISYGSSRLEDCFISTDRSSVSVRASFGGNTEGCTLAVTVDGCEQVLTPDAPEALFRIQNPKEWNAEEPNTYDVLLRLLRDGELLETYTKRVGLRDMEVSGNQFLLNGKPIRFRGINRHEYDADNGRAVTVDFIHKELLLCKRNNINSIRCSHYTNNPAFYEYCTELGIYVMDECDLESHGCGVTGDQGYLSKREDWLEVYLDRTRRMAERDKNETCVVIWSIGNEVGRGENLVKCAEYLRAFCCPKPVLQSQDGDETGNPTFCDFRQRGYDRCMPDRVLDTCPPEGKPVVFTEYEHGMGNGPGSLDEIWDLIYENPQFAGGWVWEFKSHGFHVKDEKGRDAYLYGGDFGDINSWSNFSVDGYLFSDGREKPAMHELREAYGPIRVSLAGDALRIESVRDFRALDDLTMEWTLLSDGHPVSGGLLPLPAIAARTSEEVMKLPELPEDGSELFLTLTFRNPAGLKVETRQLALREAVKAPVSPKPFAFEIHRESACIAVECENASAIFRKGRLCRIVSNGEEVLNSPMELSFYRAPTDNDGVVGLFPRHIEEWDRALLFDMKFHALSDEIQILEDSVIYKVDGLACPSAKALGFRIRLEYRIFADATVLVSMEGEPYGCAMPDTLPRIGVKFTFPSEVEKVCWYGRGFEESYRDRKLCTPFGIYEGTPENMNVLYDIPQENGNHEDTRWLTLENRLAFVGSDTLAFSYHDFTLENLTAARHCNELEKADHNTLYLDYCNRGLGSHSCGPEPLEKHELRPHSFRFVFAVSPCGEERAEQLFRSDFGLKTEALSGRFEKPAPLNEVALMGQSVRKIVREMNECKED